jgi:hypothetical protein
MINFNNKTFVCIDNPNNGDVTSETTFFFKQMGKIVRATYNGGNVKFGVLIGMINESGVHQASFNHLCKDSQISGGTCTLIPESVCKNNKLQGTWQTSKEKIELIFEEIV